MLKRKHNKRKGRQAPRGNRKAVLLVAVLLCFTVAFGVVAQWREMPSMSKPLALAPPAPTGTFNADSPSKEYIYAGGRLIATEESSSATAANSATFVSQSVPSSMVAGQSYNVSVTMRNTGTSTWTEANLYRLGAQNPQDNTNWLTAPRVYLSSATQVAPNTDVTFSFAVTAPSTPGTYNFQWRMVQDLVEWFGDYTSNVSVTVTNSASANVALAANGGVASASSSLGSGFPATAVNNGDRRGLNWGSGGGWADGTVNSFPDSLEIDFNGSKTINEIYVFGVQDDYQNPVEPTETMTFSSYGLTDFDVQYWDGSGWATVPGWSVTGNNKVWRKLTFADITTTRIRVVVNYSPNGYSRITELEAYGVSAPPTNFALATNGGVTSASSSLGSGFASGGAINGDRKGVNWGNGGGWADGTNSTFPDWLEVDFSGNKTINEIDVFGVQDDYQNPGEPTEAMTFSSYGLTDFDVQYWDGGNWVTVSGGSVTGNDKIWRKFTFSAVTTSKIRVVVNAAPNGYSRIVEVEAWGN